MKHLAMINTVPTWKEQSLHLEKTLGSTAFLALTAVATGGMKFSCLSKF